MTLEYFIPGALLAGLGILRLVLEGAGRGRGRGAVLGYLAVGMGGVLLVAGLTG